MKGVLTHTFVNDEAFSFPPSGRVLRMLENSVGQLLGRFRAKSYTGPRVDRDTAHVACSDT